VKDGGFYIVEDLQTNFGTMRAAFSAGATLSCVEYLKKLVDLRVADKMSDPAIESDEFLRRFGRRVDFVSFYRESCLIKKRCGAPADEYLIRSDKPSPPEVSMVMIAHIGCYGDRKHEGFSIRGRGVAQNIQGFSISLNGLPADQLHYKARYQDGSWSE
jgi:hypothetical protein